MKIKLKAISLAITLVGCDLFNQDPKTITPKNTWEKTLGGSDFDQGTQIIPSSDGGLIVVGSTRSFGKGNYDVWLVKLNDSGDTIWSKTFGGEELEYGSGIIETPDKGFLIIGLTQSFNPGSGSETYILKVNSAGELVNEIHFGNQNASWAKKIIKMTDGKYLTVGYQTENDYRTRHSLFIMLDANGDTIWTRVLNDTIVCAAASATKSRDGNIFVIGALSYFGIEVPLVIKLTPDLDVVWKKIYDQSHIYTALNLGNDGSIIILGETVSTRDILVFSIEENGAQNWKTTFGDPKEKEIANDLAVNSKGEIVIAGWKSVYELPDKGSFQNVYVAKLSPIGIKIWTRVYGGPYGDEAKSISLFHDGYVLCGFKFVSGNANDLYVTKCNNNGIL